MNMSYSKKTMIWSMCAALCIALPQAMRVIPGADVVYKAMQIPVMLCGMLCGAGGGVFCVLTGVFASALISGVPSAPMFPVVLSELMVMGLVCGFACKKYRSAHNTAAITYSIVFSALLGRTVAGLIAALLFSPGRESMAVWIWGYVIAGLPAFVVQLVLLPVIVKALEYSGLIRIPVSAESQGL